MNNSREFFYFNRFLFNDYIFAKKSIRMHYKNRNKFINNNNLKIKNLLFFGDMGLGNFLQHINCFEYIKSNSGINITVLFSSKSRPEITIAKNCKFIDRVIYLKKSNSNSEIIQSLYNLNKSYDSVVFKFSNNSILPFVGILCSPKLIIGHTSGSLFKSKYEEYYDIRVPFNENISESDNALNLAKSILINGTIKSHNKNSYFRKSLLINLLSKYIINYIFKKKKFIVVSPFVAIEQNWKQWPLDNFYELISYFHKKGYNIVIVGSDSEKKIVNNYFKNKLNINIHNYCGLNIFLVLELMKYCHFSLSNDSSLMHLSTYSNNLHFSIIGPSDIKRSLPVADNIIFIKENCICNRDSLLNQSTYEKILICKNRCINNIMPISAIDTIKKFII
jgi:ADP-heptose:LPS heptosyltransferase